MYCVVAAKAVLPDFRVQVFVALDPTYTELFPERAAAFAFAGEKTIFGGVLLVNEVLNVTVKIVEDVAGEEPVLRTI